MNEYIKVVAMRANINDFVETRITKGGVSPYVVMKVTGHKSMSSFERYVRLQELEAMVELKSLSFFQ